MTVTANTVHRVRTVLGTFAAVTALVTLTTGAAGTPTPAVSSAPRCHTGDLSGQIVLDDAGAGNRYGRLIVTNTSGHTCRIYGYGGLELVDADGRRVPTNLTRVPNPGPRLVTLRPGERANKNLHWGVVPVEGEPVEGPCEPPAAGADVTPPDETTTFRVWFPFGPVCGFGRIDGSAYYKG